MSSPPMSMPDAIISSSVKPALARCCFKAERVVGRIADAEGCDRLAFQPALLDVAPRLRAGPARQGRLEESGGGLDEPVQPLAFVLAGFIARGELGHRHAGLARQPLDRLGERQPLGLHHEGEDVAVLARSKAVVEALLHR